MANKIKTPLLYVSVDLHHAGIVPDFEFPPSVGRVSETIFPDQLSPIQSFDALFSKGDVAAVIVELERSWIGREHIRFVQRMLDSARTVYLYWPAETYVEKVAKSDLPRLWRMWGRAAIGRRVAGRTGQILPLTSASASIYGKGQVPGLIKRFDAFARDANPVPFVGGTLVPRADAPVSGTGVYLRMDFWAPAIAGGSYGHTCYVAKELKAVTEDLVCIVGNRFPLLDDFGIRQIQIRPSFTQYSEWHILSGGEYYYQALRPILEIVRPAYIYERLCLGNLSAARLSRELGIPYIVEYNGSEISLRRSFSGDSYEAEAAFLACEAAAFAQATAISVVSANIRDDLIQRGVDPAKIVLNPNCVDPAIYAPAVPEEKAALRRQLGFAPDHCVAGFVGTFGGWHGIDVLADSLKPIVDKAGNLRFLLIGDGNFKHLIKESVVRHGLERYVMDLGMLPQMEASRMLKACDLYLSPHGSHMVDRKFFGSPTKIFEYMALGGGIVASDLEQIGITLSPAIRPHQLGDRRLTITDERSVLCDPGNVGQFAAAVSGLASRPDLAAALGRNARVAACAYYTWEVHVQNLFRFMAHAPLVGYATEAKDWGNTVAGHS